MIDESQYEYILLILFFVYTYYMNSLIHSMTLSHPQLKIFVKEKKKQNKVYLFFYILVILISIGLLFLYVLFLFVPENNIFSLTISSTFGTQLNYFFPVIYSIISKFILPEILKKYNLHTKWETFVTIFITILFTFLLPLFFIFIMSNHCRNIWVSTWEPCYDTKTDDCGNTFDICQSKYPDEKILGHGDVCGINVMDEIIFGHCFRSVLRVISDISTQKLIYSGIVTPIIKFGFDVLKMKFQDFHSIKFLKPKFEEYRCFTSLFIYVIYLILFGFPCPIMIILVHTSVVIHFIILLFKKEYLKVTIMSSDYSISIYLLHFSLFINHMLALMFWISNNFALEELLIVFVCFFWVTYFLKKQISNQWNVYKTLEISKFLEFMETETIRMETNDVELMNVDESKTCNEKTTELEMSHINLEKDSEENKESCLVEEGGETLIDEEKIKPFPEEKQY